MDKKDFLSVEDFSSETLFRLIETATHMKTHKEKYSNALKNKQLGMIFQKSSTRTRVSFEIGIRELGGNGVFLSPRDTQLGRGEPIKDTARVLSRYLDILMIRTFAHSEAEELARYADIPVINGLTDYLHPCQAVADLQTVFEKKGKLKGVNVSYVGDGNNVAHSLGLLCSILGVNFSIATPTGYEMDKNIVDKIFSYAKDSGSKIKITNHPIEAVEGSNVIYTDVWTSMGQEKEAETRLKLFRKYQVNAELAAYAHPDYIFMHCLPAHRGEEVTDEIIESPHSVVFDQAENRLHAQKAIMLYLSEGK